MRAPGSTRRRVALAAVALALAAAAVVAGFAVFGGEDSGPATVTGPSGHDFSLVKPDAWTELSDDDRALIPGDPLMVLRRGSGEGLITVTSPARSEGDLDAVAKQLDKRLGATFRDFRKVRAREVRVRAGRALLYSYVRSRRGTAHTVLVVPGKERTYTVNAVIPAGADQAAREVGEILLSFDF